jgi:hypothetical protein
MTLQTGAHDIQDLLAARFASAVEYGLNTIEKVLQADVAAHNAIVSEMVGEMCEITTDRQRIYGTSAGGDMVEVDEYGLAPTQRSQPGATVGFPLRLFQFNVGWTYKWLQNNTPADMATMVLSAEAAHWRRIQMELKKAIYGSTNYTFYDHLVDNVTLSIKRFLNADSVAIPNGPNGEVFTPASHTHYEGEASLTAAFLKACIDDVVEHGHGGRVIAAISKTDEAAVRALSGFSAYVDPRIIYRVTDTPGTTLDISRLDNRAIGIFEGAEIQVKPWAIANYVFAWDAADPNKPLAFRERSATGLQGLRIAAENGDYPLYARQMEAEFGIGVWTRTNGSILYFANATYADPTITG